jgi:hypothetical protein
MQGTASSRAKAAAAQPASPTRSKAVKPTTATPAKGTASKRASIVPAKSTESTGTPPTKEANGNSKDSSELAKKPTAVPVAESEIDKDNAIEPVEPRTPSPRPRNIVDDDEDETEQPNVENQSQEKAGDPEALEMEKSGEASEETPRAAIIGRVGLAGAREAPSALEEPNTSPVHDQVESTKTPIANANGDNTAEAEPATTTENGGRLPIARLHPDDIDASGHVADPEMPRSAPSSDQTTKPAKNLFGRIGHPGAKAGGNELESPNPKSDTINEKKDDTPQEVEWHEEELKRDPAKTIVSPDAGKGAFAEKKED